MLCGRYEGFDERVVEHLADETISIGRYVLAGGELPAMVICDAVLRKLPGALGDAESAVEESYSEALDGAPEYPHYTRPATYRGWEVPEVLLSGDHARVREWRLEQARHRAELRPPQTPAASTASISRRCAGRRSRAFFESPHRRRLGVAQAGLPHQRPSRT